MDEPISPEMAAREAAWREANRIWLIETQKPFRNRMEFQVDVIADALARKPGRFEIDGQERRRIVIDVFEWIMRGEFDDRDVLMLVSPPQLLAPFLPEFRAVKEEAEQDGVNIWANPDSGANRPSIELHFRTIRINIEALVLRRAALHRYLEGCALDGVPRLLLEWFPESATKPPKTTITPDAGPSKMDRTGFGDGLPADDQAREPTRAPEDPQLERPPGVSESDWRIFENASLLKPGFQDRRGGISEAARWITKQSPERKFETIRRALTRVLVKLRQQ